MNRDTIINKVLRDMKLADLIPEENIGSIRLHLGLLYQAAYEDGRTAAGHMLGRPVVYFDKDWNRLGDFSSAIEAAEKLNLNRGSISRALKTRGAVNQYHFKFK